VPVEIREATTTETVLLSGDPAVVALAPHAGQMEPGTGGQARVAAEYCQDAAWWVYEACSDEGSAFSTYHVPSVRINPENYQYLDAVVGSDPAVSVGFHGFSPPGDEPDIYVGGRIPRRVRRHIADQLTTSTQFEAVSAYPGDGLWQRYSGTHLQNILTRVAADDGYTLQLEQRRPVRKTAGTHVVRITMRCLADYIDSVVLDGDYGQSESSM